MLRERRRGSPPTQLPLETHRPEGLAPIHVLLDAPDLPVLDRVDLCHLHVDGDSATGRLQAIDVLDRIRRDFALAHPGGAPTFTVSFGVTDSEQAQGLADLLSLADAGLYQAKQAGRDQAVVGEASLLAHAKAGTEAHEVSEEDEIVLARNGRPLIHEAADEEDPQPNGIQIR